MSENSLSEMDDKGKGDFDFDSSWCQSERGDGRSLRSMSEERHRDATETTGIERGTAAHRARHGGVLCTSRTSVAILWVNSSITTKFAPLQRRPGEARISRRGSSWRPGAAEGGGDVLVSCRAKDPCARPYLLALFPPPSSNIECFVHVVNTDYRPT